MENPQFSGGKSRERTPPRVRRNDFEIPAHVKENLSRESQRLMALEKPEKLKQFLEWVNYDSIEKIFTELYTQSSVDSAEFRFISRDRIVVAPQNLVQQFTTAAAFLPQYNIIDMGNIREFETIAEDENVPLNWLILRVFFHELGHASSPIELAYNLTSNLVVPIQSGLETREILPERKVSLDSFTALNEGVTERIQVEALYKYVATQPLTKRLQLLLLVKKVLKLTDVYKRDCKVSLFVVKRIAQKRKLSKKQAWQELKRWYFEGFHLLGAERLIALEYFTEVELENLAIGIIR